MVNKFRNEHMQTMNYKTKNLKIRFLKDKNPKVRSEPKTFVSEWSSCFEIFIYKAQIICYDFFATIKKQSQGQSFTF